MTTRQFISILLSCILFAHPLTGGQWLGTVMVFGEAGPVPGFGGQGAGFGKVGQAGAGLQRQGGYRPGQQRQKAARGLLLVSAAPVRVSALQRPVLRCACPLPRPPHPAGALYYKSLSKGSGGSKSGSTPKAGAGEAGADPEKLPLVHADATGAAQAAQPPADEQK